MLDLLEIIFGLLTSPRFAGCLILGAILATIINSCFGDHPLATTVSVFLCLALMVIGLLWDIRADKNKDV